MSIKLSPYHEMFYNDWQLDPMSSKYNIVFDQTVSADLDIERLRSALHHFVYEHLLVNSHINDCGNELYWEQNSKISELEYFHKLSTDKQILDYVSKPFNIKIGPLYRFAIFKQNDDNYRFVLVWHHLLMDAVSVEISIKEISNYYNSSLYQTHYSTTVQKNIIIETTKQFYDQLQLYKAKYKTFWSEVLLNVEPLDLRFLKPTNVVVNPNITMSDKIKELRFEIESEKILQLSHITRKLGVTNYIYGQCIFAILLNRYTNQNKFAISYPVSILGGINFICGVKVNTNLRVYNFSDTTTIIDLFEQNRNFNKAAKKVGINCKYYPIDKIISNEHKGLLNVMFADTTLKDCKFNFLGTDTIKINHDFNIDLANTLLFEQEFKENKLYFRVKYNLKDIDSNIIKNFARHYQTLFYALLEDMLNGETNKLVSQYDIFDTSEYQRIVYDWNKTHQAYPLEKTIHGLFEDQVDKTPDNVAIVYNDISLTYKQLNIKANHLANILLNNYSLKKEALVLVCLDRSECLLIVILAIFKAGAAYVPIDPSYPDERIKYIMQDTRSEIAITNQIHRDRLKGILTPIHQCELNVFTTPQPSFTIISRDKIKQNLSVLSNTNPRRNVTGNNLAYVIYTSGTTGVPKGVMIEHKSVINTVFSICPSYGVNSDELQTVPTKVTAFCNYIFDVSVSEFLVALFNGYELHIFSDNVRQDINLISKYINENSINYVYLPPVLLAELPRLKYKSLKGLIYAGEPCDPSTALYWSSKYRLYNYYGPTETTIYATMIQINNGNSQLIGKPLNNTQTYVLDKNLKPVPIGAIGELHISGIGVARGYLNQPQLTRTKFINNPFQTQEESILGVNSKIYKTGDLVRFYPDGRLEYIGRSDSQVKIRGYRIELNEIANMLSTYPNIKSSIVLLKSQIPDHNLNKENKKNSEPQSDYIIAYYTSEHELFEKDIINYLATKIPHYMLPSMIIQIKNMQITLQGKLDYSALPAPKLNLKTEFVAPSNDQEFTLCKAYADILKLPLEQIGVNHDFFALGGNSILAIRLTAMLQNNFKISVNDIFKLRTPHELANNLEYIKDNLRFRLEKVKGIYSELAKHNIDSEISLNSTYFNYIEGTRKIDFKIKAKNIQNILLTGATGYLGCNILYQLLTTTEYKIYTLVRSSSDSHAYSRIRERIKFYFDLELDYYKKRLVVLASDIEKKDLNLADTTYQSLVANIDSIIHSAALVKHYGDYEEFYLANVQATANLLELCKLTKLKDFHYISTTSVFTDGFVPGKLIYVFNEDSDTECLQNQTNFYVQTKRDGEVLVIKYREYGINGNIYRVGNLSMHSQNYKNQVNLEENAFFTRLKAIVQFGVIPDELSQTEISPVDCTALAIVKLFDQSELSNQAFHVYNPYKGDLFELLSSHKGIKIVKSTFDEFTSTILQQLENGKNIEQIQLFMLHQLWLQEINPTDFTHHVVLQDKTSTILDKLNFKWMPITTNMLSGVVKHLKKT